MSIVPFFFLSLCAHGEEIYTRSQCIVKAELKWKSDVSFDVRQNTLGAMSRSFANEFSIVHQSIPPAMSYRGDNQEYIYFQLNRMCNHRYEILRNIASRVWTNYETFSKITIHDEIVRPGNDTINVYGPYWTDGDSDHRFSDKSIKLYFYKNDN